MERQHRKPVDPTRFKQRDLSDLSTSLETNRQRAQRFLREDSIRVENCPICAGEERRTARQMFGYEYVQCVECTHVYLTERPTQEALLEYFESSEELAGVYTDDRQRRYRREHITEPKIDFVLDQLNRDGGQWLDVGCGMGESVEYLREEGWDAVGLEPSADCVRVAREEFGIDLVQQSLEEYADGDEDGTFDVVSLFGILIMTADPVAELKRVRELLDDDGVVAIGDGHYDSVSSRVHQALPDRAVRHSIPPIGLHQFTGESIERMFEAAGFESVAVWYFGLDFYEFLNHLRLEFDGFAETALYEYFMNNLNEFQGVIDDDERSDYVVVVGRTT